MATSPGTFNIKVAKEGNVNMRYTVSHYPRHHTFYRCSSCGVVAPVLTWIRGNSWHGGYYACDSCVRSIARENLAILLVGGAICLLPVVALMGWILLGFVQVFVQALR